MPRIPVAASQAVKEFARAHDVDMVGVTSVETLEKVWTRKKADWALPGARSLVVFGMMMPAGSLYQSITVGFNYRCTRRLEVCPVGR